MKYLIAILLLAPSLASAQVTLNFTGATAERDASRFTTYLRYELKQLPPSFIMQNVLGKPMEQVTKTVFSYIKLRQETKGVTLKYASTDREKSRTVYEDRYQNGDQYEAARNAVFGRVYTRLGLQ